MLNRRGFLATLAAVPLAALLPMTASAPVMACQVPRDMLPMSTCHSEYGIACLVNDGMSSGAYAGIPREPWVGFR